MVILADLKQYIAQVGRKAFGILLHRNLINASFHTSGVKNGWIGDKER